MENNLSLLVQKIQTHKWLVILGVIFLLIFFPLLVLSLFRVSPPISPNVFPTPTPFLTDNQGNRISISPLQQAQINQPLTKSIADLPQPAQKVQNLKTGETTYTYASPIALKQNQITVKNGVVTFERILTPEDPSTKGYATISQYKRTFGQAEKEIHGSKSYGWYITSYLYPHKGFAVIGNSNTDEVYELQTFQPMDINAYIHFYGQDLDPTASPARE